MNENLCKVLEGCEGTELYSPMFGQVTLLKITEDSIMIDSGFNYSHYHYFTKEGYYVVYANAINAECTIFPSKKQRDWSKFEKPIPIDTPFMVCDVPDAGCGWHLYFYANYDEECEQHRVFLNGEKSKVDYNKPTTKFKYMIPYDKFDPCNIEESLKYNIQK